MKIKSVFFDLDGTLLDTALDLGAALNATLKQFDLPILTPEEIRPHVSNGANALIKLGFGEDLSDAEHQVRRQSLLDYYLENVAQYTIAFSGIETLLEQLNQQGIVWGIATNKPRLYAEALMDQITLPSEHIALICPEDIENRKPAPDSLFFACELAKCQPHELVYIGDHVRDIECAKAAQCPNIAAAYGYINEPDTIQHWQADHIANEAADIFPILEKNQYDTMKTDKKLNQKIVLITGAGDGLGRSLAIECARAGATVVLLGRTLKKLEEVYDEIEDEKLPTPAIFPINLESATSPEYKDLRTILEREFRHVDIIVHNAGATSKRTPICNTSADDWSKVIQVNATAPFLLSKALLPILEKSSDGKLVFTSSSLAHQGKAYWGAYAAAKATALNLMQTLADEFEDSSTAVFSVDPVAVRGPFRANSFPAEDPSTIPSADEVAPKYLALLTKKKEEVHGQSLQL